MEFPFTPALNKTFESCRENRGQDQDGVKYRVTMKSAHSLLALLEWESENINDAATLDADDGYAKGDLAVFLCIWRGMAIPCRRRNYPVLIRKIRKMTSRTCGWSKREVQKLSYFE